MSIDAYRRQQSRWATGSFQAAFSLLVPVMRSDNRLAVKVQAAIHLLAYSVGPLMLLQLLCYPFLLVSSSGFGLPWQLAAASIWINVIGVSPWVGFMVAQTRRGRTWWSGAPSLLCQVIGPFAESLERPGIVFLVSQRHFLIDLAEIAVLLRLGFVAADCLDHRLNLGFGRLRRARRPPALLCLSKRSGDQAADGSDKGAFHESRRLLMVAPIASARRLPGAGIRALERIGRAKPAVPP